MTTVKLTKSADTLMCLMYKEYCQRRNSGSTIADACYMGDDSSIHMRLAPKWHLDDITDLCWYLKGKNLLDVYPGDDKANDVSLSEDGILYMEQRFPDGVKTVVNALSHLAQVVAPWL